VSGAYAILKGQGEKASPSTKGKIVTNDTVAFDLDTVNALHRFEEAKRAIREAEAVKSEAEATIREALGSAVAGTVAGVTVIRVSERERVSISASAVKEADEALYNALAKTTAYTVLVTA
jgi:predicted phage-related endonuclease